MEVKPQDESSSAPQRPEPGSSESGQAASRFTLDASNDDQSRPHVAVRQTHALAHLPAADAMSLTLRNAQQAAHPIESDASGLANPCPAFRNDAMPHQAASFAAAHAPEPLVQSVMAEQGVAADCQYHFFGAHASTDSHSSKAARASNPREAVTSIEHLHPGLVMHLSLPCSSLGRKVCPAAAQPPICTPRSEALPTTVAGNEHSSNSDEHASKRACIHNATMDAARGSDQPRSAATQQHAIQREPLQIHNVVSVAGNRQMQPNLSAPKLAVDLPSRDHLLGIAKRSVQPRPSVSTNLQSPLRLSSPLKLLELNGPNPSDGMMHTHQHACHPQLPAQQRDHQKGHGSQRRTGEETSDSVALQHQPSAPPGAKLDQHGKPSAILAHTGNACHLICDAGRPAAHNSA